MPVLDLRAGRAVHGHGGRRDTYRPVRSVLVPVPDAGDPLALAAAFEATLACDECYVADLDAIAGAAPQRTVLRALAGAGSRLLVDAGVRDVARARQLLEDGVARVVV